MIQQVSEWFQRVTRGATATPWSFVRIHLWALAALVVAGAVMGTNTPNLRRDQYNRIIDSPRSRVVSLDSNDPRGFDPTPNAPNRFDVAWLGGSSLQSIGEGYYEFIPALTRDAMGRVDGAPVDMDIYFLSGMRILDEYAALLAALESEPELVVISLNPVWALNDAAIQSWANLDAGVAAGIVTRPEAWLFGAQTVSPTDALFGLVGSHIAPLRDRWSYADDARGLVDDWDILDRPNPEDVARPEPVGDGVTAAAPELSELARIRAMTSPLEFWSTYRLDTPDDTSLEGRQLAFLAQSSTDGDLANDTVIELMGAALRDAGIPAYVYMAPVDPAALANPALDAALAAIEGRLAELAPAFDAPHISYNPVNLGRTIGPLPFNDLVHIGQAEPLAEWLAVELCDFMNDLENSTCSSSGARP